MTKTKKRLIAIIVSVAVVLSALATFLIVRTVINRRPPELESIRARGLRPSEGALTPGVGAYRGNGAAHLSRRDRAEMAMRSLRGERIEF